jgi:hypothetical protein
MAFPNGYPWDLLNALEAALADASLTGRRIADIRPPGEAYEFMFAHDGKTLYGKVNLITSGPRTVMVVSAHTPNRGDSL